MAVIFETTESVHARIVYKGNRMIRKAILEPTINRFKSPAASIHIAVAFIRLLYIPIVILVSGCGGSRLLFKQETFDKIKSTPTAGHCIIYFDKKFTYTPDGRLFEKTYSIVRVGEDAISFPAFIGVFDYSLKKLIDVEGRVTHKDGSIEVFSKSDFNGYNMSDRNVIAEEYEKYTLIDEKIKTGDLIETVSIHESTFPQLGINFSFEELQYPAENITCSIEIGHSDSLQYKIVNSTVHPIVADSITGKRFIFHWDSYTPPTRRHRSMEKLNQSPQLLALRMPQSWQSFGDWYLQMAAPKLQPDSAIIDQAKRITSGKTTAKEKMDTIFEYCQKNIRYEQEYIEHGEIIPNAAYLIFSRKYGDCKDYATIMYAMAESVGLHPHLVLCYRGRGEEFFDSIPLPQFNHCLLSFEYGGTNYWYDGTNRVGLSGITTIDLANAKALVLEKGNSRILTIEESPNNLLTIEGTFVPTGENSLKGNIAVTFLYQYAIDFFWLEYRTNKENMTNQTIRILKRILNENMIVDTLTWIAEKSKFVVSASCDIPNCRTTLRMQSYASIAKIFPNLLPDDIEDEQQYGIFYFPFFNRVSLNLRIPNDSRTVRLQLQYQLPAGPFDDSGRDEFLRQLNSATKEYTTIHNLNEASPQ